MRQAMRHVLLAGAAVLALPAVAAAQKRPIEFGVDAGVQFDLKSPKTTVVSFPVQTARVGFFVSDRLSIEPALSFNYFKPEGDDGTTIMQGRLSVLYHFSADLNKPGFFIQPLVGLRHIGGGGSSNTQFDAGGGIGFKAPVGSHMAFRLQGLYNHGFETDTVAASDVVSILVGISFYTH